MVLETIDFIITSVLQFDLELIVFTSDKKVPGPGPKNTLGIKFQSSDLVVMTGIPSRSHWFF